ncbi:HEAT repeat domain-containing protein [Alkalinema sp. FACHB-956]|uniref:HEAT repeat domain-containing protein n=1 Tax=Alkalinema sp. FACHB-956 TaxID=2692768 RepID=UPI001688EE0A|nr:HEAT repeat domain-containing protein [Alkalinema sp. FACHB-956]MBD2327888.1 HEAT repeat domain-containing protein [Alkalinema sp. FACHB-956]
MSSAIALTLLHNIEQADSASKLADAVQLLADAAMPETVPHLIKALGYNNPGAALAAIDGLVKIGQPAVEPLLNLLDDYNYGARAWAIRALSLIGDPRALPVLQEAALNDFALSVRRAAARGLGFIDWPSLSASQNDIQETIQVLLQVLQDPEWVVRFAATTALHNLATLQHNPGLLEQLQTLVHNDPSLTVRARAQWAIQSIAALEP